ncbi:MAG: hypothetical protein KF729_27050 [Sandaracinaceae bacterium]|nr:hypothetical protein [Sandaracinaceae bacterium]
MRFALWLALSLAAPAAAQDDPAPLYASLRAEERARVPSQVEGDAAALPVYELALELSDDLRSFTLEETVHWTNDAGRPLSSVVLRVWANAVSPSPLVTLVSARCEGNATCEATTPSPDAIVLRLSQPVPAGGRLTVRLSLRGRLAEIDPARTTLAAQGLEGLGALSGGHGAGDYGLLAHSDGVASMASFFPVLARMRGGLWEQSDASTMGDLGNDALSHVDARVRVADGVRVVAVGLEEPPLVVGDRTEVRVRAAFVRDFALVAGRRLARRERSVGSVAVRSWFVEGREAAGARALDAAAHALALFERRFGPYPWTQLDVVEAPLVGGAGGVEFSSMVTIATMFYRPAGDAGGGPLAALLGGDLEARREAMLEMVVAHEVGHQFWHGVVGSDSREHPFQDEALAQYAAMLYVEDRYGAARAERETREQVTSGYHAMRLMGRPDGRVDRPVSAFADPLSYGGLVYGKAPHLYVALRRVLGDRAFFGALREHVAAYRFRTAPPRALYERMARGPRAARVRTLVTRWLDQTHGDADLGQADLGRLLGGGAGGDAAALRGLLDALGGGGNDAALRGLLDALGGRRGGGNDAALRGLLDALGGGGLEGLLGP